MRGADWDAYLASFHSERAGITEVVLEHAVDGHGRTPYDWAAEAVEGADVLDLACGSAPMAGRLTGRRYIGLDLSAAELVAAAARGVPVVRADARRLPVSDAAVDTVVVSMALMLVPLGATLAEARRVLRPGGKLVATVPHSRPLPAADWVRYARLCVALRHRGLHYPNDAVLADAPAAFAAAGLTLESDEAGAFSCSLVDERVADQLLASLYLPDVAPERIHAGRRVVRRWTGTRLTTPVRRLVARSPR